MRRLWRRVAPLLAHARPLLGVAVALAAVQSALLIPIALLIQHVFDDAVPRRDEAGIVLAGVGVIGLYVAAGAISLLARGLLVRRAKLAVGALRRQLLGQVYGLSSAWHDRHGRDWVHGVVVQDTERVDQAISQLLTQSGPAAVVVAALCVVALALSPLLFGVLLAVLPVMLFASRWLGARFRTRVGAWHRSFDTYSADTHGALRALPLAKAEGAEDWELRRRAGGLDELAEAGTSLVRAQGAYTVVHGTVAAGAGVVVLVVGGVAVARGSMTAGQLLSFYAVVGLILRQLSILLDGVPVVLAGLGALERVETILDASEPDPYTGTRRIELRGGWALDGVTFGYAGEDVLREVDLVIEPGERVVLVGPNGAGKTTAVNVMLGLYRPTRGCVRADGVALDELDVRHLRGQVGVVLQDPLLFRGTVAENIAYGRPDATEADIRTAAERATADTFVRALPAGYATALGDDAVRLSGGQRQRIAIARALLGDPALLVLDEPTTHLDDAAIGALMANLTGLPRAPSVIIVTHDPGVAARADRIVHLRDGRIVGVQAPGRLEPAEPEYA
ncbi:MAG: ATP-binding cassette, subfamily bacterial [Solirubrobacteraceae bacterium]|nr:ATP-binding cassette, subfamily bacterial [Solirubrobacteraceae bacterium]